MFQYGSWGSNLVCIVSILRLQHGRFDLHIVCIVSILGFNMGAGVKPNLYCFNFSLLGCNVGARVQT